MALPRLGSRRNDHRVLSGYGLGRLRRATADLLRRFCNVMSHNERKPRRASRETESAWGADFFMS